MTLGDTLAGALCAHHHWVLYGQCAGCDRPFRKCLGEEIQRTIDRAVRDAVEETTALYKNVLETAHRAVAEYKDHRVEHMPQEHTCACPSPPPEIVALCKALDAHKARKEAKP